MIGKDQAQSIISEALAAARDSEQAEATLFVDDSSLTRFAENQIHQNVSERSTNLQVRVIENKRIGIASGNRVDSEGIREIVLRAQTVARNVDPNPDFISLPKPEPWATVSAFHDATARQNPTERAEAVRKVIENAKKSGFRAAGSYSVSATEMAIANSLGVMGYHPFTNAELLTVVMGDDCSGYARISSGDVSKIDADWVGTTATDKCLRGRNPISIEAGKYDVILEEEAVFDLMQWMAFQYFSAQAVEEGRTFMTPFGRKVMGENFTLYDDAADPDGFPVPFDLEGTPKRRVMLIENGVSKAVVYNSYYAHKEDKPNTGHSAGTTEESIPLHLHIVAGDTAKEKMIERIEKGLWITRFHYVNGFVDPINTIFTGMTRDGTFLIENGKITQPVKNLRFTQSMLEAFSNIDCLSEMRKAFSVGGFMSMVVPAMLIRKFNFSSVTGH